MIVKIDLLKKHVDLSKIVSISDAYFMNRMGSGGHYVGFEIDVQLLDHPLKYERKLEYSEEDHEGYRTTPKYTNNGMKTLAEVNLQREIDEIINLWKQFV